MSSNDFALWLHGFFELTDATELTPAQVAMIKEHLALVFNKVTKPLEKPTPPTKMLTEGEDPQRYKAKPIKKPSDNSWGLTEQERKELDKLAEISWPIKNKNPWPGLGDLTRPYCEPKSPYNGVTPIADWTVRFPYHCDFYTTTPTYVNLPTTVC